MDHVKKYIVLKNFLYVFTPEIMTWLYEIKRVVNVILNDDYKICFEVWKKKKCPIKNVSGCWNIGNNMENGFGNFFFIFLLNISCNIVHFIWNSKNLLMLFLLVTTVYLQYLIAYLLLVKSSKKWLSTYKILQK